MMVVQRAVRVWANLAGFSGLRKLTGRRGVGLFGLELKLNLGLRETFRPVVRLGVPGEIYCRRPGNWEIWHGVVVGSRKWKIWHGVGGWRLFKTHSPIYLLTLPLTVTQTNSMHETRTLPLTAAQTKIVARTTIICLSYRTFLSNLRHLDSMFILQDNVFQH